MEEQVEAEGNFTALSKRYWLKELDPEPEIEIPTRKTVEEMTKRFTQNQQQFLETLNAKQSSLDALLSIRKKQNQEKLSAAGKFKGKEGKKYVPYPLPKSVEQGGFTRNSRQSFSWQMQ